MLMAPASMHRRTPGFESLASHSHHNTSCSTTLFKRSPRTYLNALYRSAITLLHLIMHSSLSTLTLIHSGWVLLIKTSGITASLDDCTEGYVPLCSLHDCLFTYTFTTCSSTLLAVPLMPSLLCRSRLFLAWSWLSSPTATATSTPTLAAVLSLTCCSTLT